MRRRHLVLLLAVALASSSCAGGQALPGWNEFIVTPLINALVFLYDIFRDFGVAIVLLTVVIRVALYPLFLAQLRSQRVQQELGPAIAELRKKYKEDRQRFAQEQMKLYQERGFNPLSGCLPLLLQMPILFGLYSALTQVGCGLGQIGGTVCPGLTSDELSKILYPFVANPVPSGEVLPTHSIFLPWSVKGLAQPDPWFILPAVAGIVTFFSSAMTMPPKSPPTDDPMQKSMQGMAYYTPIITFVFGLGLPAGLSLYWTVTTVFSILQQWLTSGWGRLGVWVPALPRLVPSPAARAMREETREAVRELERDMSRSGGGDAEQRGERRRRRRRR